MLLRIKHKAQMGRVNKYLQVTGKELESRIYNKYTKLYNQKTTQRDKIFEFTLH